MFVDADRFDTLAKSAATSTSRRRVLRTLFAGIAGGLFTTKSTSALALEAKVLASAPALECPKCGDCLYCDPDSDVDGCVPCTEDECLAATLCAEANQDTFNGRLRTSLEKRGFIPDGAPEAVVIVTGGTPSGTLAGLGSHYTHAKRSGEDAFLIYLPWSQAGADSLATVLRNGASEYVLTVGNDGRVVKSVPPEASGGSVRAFVELRQGSQACAECYQMCDELNSSAGNAVACTALGAAVCSRAVHPAAVLACGVAAAFVCNRGSAACNDVYCESVLGCPHVCDPACENTDVETGKCIDICRKRNTYCTNRACKCKYVTCGDECCNEGQVCKDGRCHDCGPCQFPNNAGECFDLCAPTSTGQEAGECCVSEDNPRGTCCFSREHCCDGVCKDKRRNPKCGSGPHKEECCEEGWPCLDAVEGGTICCDPCLVCGSTCCRPNDACAGGICCDTLSECLGETPMVANCGA